MTGSAADRAPPRPATSSAVVYLLLARAVRDFGDGFAAILLPVYLLELGYSPLQIGVLATVALRGGDRSHACGPSTAHTTSIRPDLNANMRRSRSDRGENPRARPDLPAEHRDDRPRRGRPNSPKRWARLRRLKAPRAHRSRSEAGGLTGPIRERRGTRPAELASTEVVDFPV
jgi:hypothetical protein